MSPHRRVWRWLDAHPWVTSLVMVGLIGAGSGYVLVEQNRDQDAFASCVAGWADEASARSVAIGEARRKVDETNDDLWRTMARLLANPGPGDREEFAGHLATYVSASDAYKASLKSSPVPPSPRLAC